MSTDVSQVRDAFIIRALMMEAARTSETSVDIQLRTRQYIPEDSELHTRRRENLESQHTVLPVFIRQWANLQAAQTRSIIAVYGSTCRLLLILKLPS
jgi:hypothetical protein